MVVNPVSGGVDKSSFIAATSLFAENQNQNFILFETTGENDVVNLNALYLKYNPERVIVAGGDGTIKMVAEALEKHDVIIGILPVGSANGLAMELNLIKTFNENLSIAFNNDSISIDVIEINGIKCLHLSDLGLNAKLIKNYQKNAVHGIWGYFTQVFKTLYEKNHPFKTTITIQDTIVKEVSEMIVIANAKKYGTGVVINPNGIINDGKFELIILKKLDLSVFGKIILGRLSVESEFIEIISTDKATIKITEPVSFQIDGEFCGSKTELDIRISPYKLKIAIP